MSENAQKPRIRFKGFSDAWEQRKFEDAFIERREKTVTENEDTLLSCAINGMFLNSELFGHFRGTTTIGYLKVKKNDLILSAQNLHLGNANVNLRFEHGIISPAYKVYDLNNCEPEFVQAWVKKEDTKNFFLAATTEGASQCRKNIEWDTLGKQTICMPAIKEQATIGSFFKCVDNLITLHQRKYDKLVAVKKSLLEKMFPADGETVPKIRFKGFSDAWEQRKLGDIGKARSGVGFPDAEQGGVTGIPFFKVSDMNLGGNENEMTVANNYVTAEQIAVHRWSPITELPAIFFAKVGAAVMLNRKRLCRFPFLLDNNTMAYSLSSTKWDADFAKALFGTVDLTSLVQVGALPSYNAGDVESMEIYLPSLLEQEQIGGFFKQLDNLITLHQRQLEKLKNIKSALLEKMFV